MNTKVTIRRLNTGVPGLDQILGGGLPSGYSLLVAGPSGSGKTILATKFLSEGVRCVEPGVIVAFEQVPSQSWIRTLNDLIRKGQLGLINTRSLDLSIDEIVQNLTNLIQKMKATRVVIEVGSCLKRVMAVVKVCASNHSNEIRQFEITDGGIVIGGPVLDYEGILGGQPTRITDIDTALRGKP